MANFEAFRWVISPPWFHQAKSFYFCRVVYFSYRSIILYYCPKNRIELHARYRLYYFVVFVCNTMIISRMYQLPISLLYGSSVILWLWSGWYRKYGIEQQKNKFEIPALASWKWGNPVRWKLEKIQNS